MGNSNSLPKKEETKKEDDVVKQNNVVVDTKTEESLTNIKKIMPKENEENTSDVLETLNITEFKKEKSIEQTGGKKQIPLLGGFKVNNNLDDISENGFGIGGFENKTGRKRYTKYDLFKILKNLDIDTEIEQDGGYDGGDNDKDINTESSLNDEQSMEHIKNIILKELETLKNNKSQQLGGAGCGCDGFKDKKSSHKMSSKINYNNLIVDSEDSKQVGGTVIIDASSSSSSSDSSSDTSSTEMGKYKSKSKSKSKSNSKSKLHKYAKSHESSESSQFVIETSESGKEKNESDKEKNESDKEKSDEDKHTSNGEESEEGLSIFPFNSSDVKSSLSIKNYRMLRRKI